MVEYYNIIVSQYYVIRVTSSKKIKTDDFYFRQSFYLISFRDYLAKKYHSGAHCTSPTGKIGEF